MTDRKPREFWLVKLSETDYDFCIWYSKPEGDYFETIHVREVMPEAESPQRSLPEVSDEDIKEAGQAAQETLKSGNCSVDIAYGVGFEAGAKRMRLLMQNRNNDAVNVTLTPEGETLNRTQRERALFHDNELLYAKVERLERELAELKKSRAP